MSEWEFLVRGDAQEGQAYKLLLKLNTMLALKLCSSSSQEQKEGLLS